MTEFANIVDLFENTLSRPLSKKELIKHGLGLNEIRALAIESRQEYYKKTIPPKESEFEIRPFIPPEFNMGIMDYAVGGNVSKSFNKFIFDKNIPGKMNASIKQLLLYSHSIVINDPLDYILDYFFLNQDDNPPDFILGRIEAANSLLIEYSEIADLIKNRIVIPVEMFALGRHKSLFQTEASSASLTEKLSQEIPAEEIKKYEHIIYDIIGRYNMLEGKVDFFFPEQNYVYVLKEILKSMGEKFLSKDIHAQLDAAFLTKLKIIDVESLTTQDIVNIRQNEEIFERWRAFLSAALKKTSDNIDNCSDLNDEFKATVNAEFNEGNNDLIKRVKQSAWGSNLKDSSKNIGIGMIAGCMPSLFTNSPEGITAGAIIGATAEGSIRAILAYLNYLRGHKSNAALRSHFVAIGTDIKK